MKYFCKMEKLCMNEKRYILISSQSLQNVFCCLAGPFSGRRRDIPFSQEEKKKKEKGGGGQIAKGNTQFRFLLKHLTFLETFARQKKSVYYILRSHCLTKLYRLFSSEIRTYRVKGCFSNVSDLNKINSLSIHHQQV